MATEIKIWRVQNGKLKELEEAEQAVDYLEKELESWIVSNPEILGERLLVIGRQTRTAVGILDLLCIDHLGRVVIVELKRDMAPRQAIAQALQYAAWLNALPVEELCDIAQNFCKKPLVDAFSDFFSNELPDDFSPQNHRVVIAASKLDSEAETIVNYLAQRGLGVNAVFFRYAHLPPNHQLLVRSVLIPESVTASAGSPRRPTFEELYSLADQRGVRPIIEILKNGLTPDYAECGPSRSSEGSLKFHAKELLERSRSQVLFRLVMNEKKYKTPPSQLDVVVRPEGIAAVSGVKETEVEKRLAVFARAPSKRFVIRLRSEKDAKNLVAIIRVLEDLHAVERNKADAAEAAAAR